MMKTSLIQLFFYLLANYLNYVAFDQALALLGCLIEKQKKTKNKKKTKSTIFQKQPFRVVLKMSKNQKNQNQDLPKMARRIQY